MSDAADWVGAGGSVLAAATAVTVYTVDKWQARKRRIAEVAEQASHKKLIQVEAERLAKLGRGRLSNTVAKQKLGGRLSDSEKRDVAAEVGRVMRRLNELKSIATFDPQFFSQIGQLCDCFLLIDPEEGESAFIGECSLALHKLDERLSEFLRASNGST